MALTLKPTMQTWNSYMFHTNQDLFVGALVDEVCLTFVLFPMQCFLLNDLPFNLIVMKDLRLTNRLAVLLSTIFSS